LGFVLTEGKVVTAARKKKVATLEEAAKLVVDGSRVALGGFGIYQRPMAFARALINLGRKNLTLVGVVNGMEADLLIAAGVVSHIETSYVGFEKFGLAGNFRRACERGQLKVVEYPELLSWDRFRASQENLAFWPAAGLGGTDIVNQNPDIKAFNCPVTGQLLHALPAANPDVVVLHGLAADQFGNVVVPSFRNLAQSLDLTLARSCETVIVTVEAIVSDNFVRRHARLVEIPAARVSVLAVTPFGAHPNSMLGRYAADDQHWTKYVEASRSEVSCEQYLQEYVRKLPDHEAYLDKIGGSHLASLLQVDTQQ
jgi:glutaconate CoA-transferase subunit A